MLITKAFPDCSECFLHHFHSISRSSSKSENLHQKSSNREHESLKYSDINQNNNLDKSLIKTLLKFTIGICLSHQVPAYHAYQIEKTKVENFQILLRITI